MKNEHYYLNSILVHLKNIKNIVKDTETIMSVQLLSLYDDIEWLEEYIDMIEKDE